MRSTSAWYSSAVSDRCLADRPRNESSAESEPRHRGRGNDRRPVVGRIRRLVVLVTIMPMINVLLRRRNLSQAVAGITRIEILGRHPAELARRRGNLEPPLAAAAALRRAFENLHHLALPQSHLDHFADVAETAADPGRHAILDDHGQIVVGRLQEAAGNPRKAAIDGPNRAPPARIVSKDLDLLASTKLVGRVVVLPRSAADVDVVGRNGDLVGKVLIPANWGYKQDLATQEHGNQQTHGYASWAENKFGMRGVDKIATMQAADL